MSAPIDVVVDVDELHMLLEEAGKRGFLWYLFGADQDGPEVLAGVFAWRGYADVVVLIDGERAHAYRTPTGATADPFEPGDVLWWYGGCPMWTLRALLTLPEPGRPDAPATLAPAPPGSGVPGNRVPVRVRRRGH